MPVPEDMPETGGANASLPFGMATQFQAERHDIASAGSGPPPGGPPPPQQQPGAPPHPPQQGQAAQPPPSPPGQGGQRLDMGSVFPPMPELDGMDKKPWRMQLRTFAYHPDAGPAFAKYKALIDEQHGPQY